MAETKKKQYNYTAVRKHGCFRVSFGWMLSEFCLQQKQEISEILGRFERTWCVQRFARTQRKSYLYVFLMKFWQVVRKTHMKIMPVVFYFYFYIFSHFFTNNLSLENPSSGITRWTYSHHCQIADKNSSKRWNGEFRGFRICIGWISTTRFFVVGFHVLD